MSDNAGEKTLEPTPYRRQQARREGRVAKSRDLGSALMLLAGLGLLALFGGGLMHFLVAFCRAQLGGAPWMAVDAESVAGLWNATLASLAQYMLPLLGLLFLAGAAVNVIQIGFLFLPERVAIDFTRVSPLQGMSRIFSPAGVVGLGFGVFKLFAAMCVAGVVLYGQHDAILGLTSLSPSQIVAEGVRIGFWVLLKVGAALLVWIIRINGGVTSKT